MRQLLGGKVRTAAAAIAEFARHGATIGMGGQNINRCPMALTHELIRQGIGGLTVLGCNLSLPLDQLAAAGLVTRTEQGSGNLERYGVLFAWRRAVERGEITVRDYSHLAMASRFLAATLGLPFLPVRSLLGTDLGRDLQRSGDASATTDPWTGQPVLLVRACSPDLALVHASLADADGNVVIEGVSSHEVDMVTASKAAIVSAEKVLPSGAFAEHPERVTISGAHVDAVVEQPFGAYPTSVYRHYDFDEPAIERYQSLARSGTGLTEHLRDSVTAHPDFTAELAGLRTRCAELEASMLELT
ncbi:CoA transferase subunit A [Sciscionella sediminilitoris]|uniref:CoA transferase subunit A n=1 Tax=Sciscionella sediminilitoris TaxID=1445613 RepID=UPI001E419ED8|nr:CoA-transferase [Sciscionella sp. SE31]